jgi:ATP-dependent Clp protease ATP-binding subunit ClpC
VLFDEIEKAHPDVANLLLQILEEGALTDSEGRRVDFSHTLVLLTSNLGARHLSGQRTALGFGAGEANAAAKRLALQEAKAYFRPELIGRLDGLLVFRALAQADLCRIAETQLCALEQRAAAQCIRLTHTPEAVPLLVRQSYDASGGARSLRHGVARHVTRALADKVLAGCPAAAWKLCVQDDALQLVACEAAEN